MARAGLRVQHRGRRAGAGALTARSSPPPLARKSHGARRPSIPSRGEPMATSRPKRSRTKDGTKTRSTTRTANGKRTSRPKATSKSTSRKRRPSASRRWSKKVNETSDALDLEPRVFLRESARRIALSLKRSAEQSHRRHSAPYRSAMSMLTFYINRAGKNLPPARKRTLERAKTMLRELFGSRKNVRPTSTRAKSRERRTHG